jgi:hypothetical protein
LHGCVHSLLGILPCTGVTAPSTHAQCSHLG